MEPYGTYDASKSGKLTIGWGGAMETPFPSVNTEGIIVRGKPEYFVNELVDPEEVNTDDFIVAANLRYRWRYLDQIVGEWRNVTLDPETFIATSALDLPKDDSGEKLLEGDVEFQYALTINAPFYRYYDYSGSNMNLPNGYDEEFGYVTNACNYAGYLPTRGTDWFFRLRRGQSDFEGVKVEFCGEDGAADSARDVQMWMIDNHTWRGIYKTLDTDKGTEKFRVVGCNPQTPGDYDWTITNKYFAVDKGDGRTNLLPISGTLDERENEAAFADDDWRDLEIDAATGYIMFQVDDSVNSITAVHADYQNFSSWNDAKGDIFVGTFGEDASAPASGTSSRTKLMQQDFSTWLDMPATNVLWQESFSGSSENPLDTDVNTKFSLSDTPNGWSAGSGWYVFGRYNDSSQGYALKMEGDGRGYLQYSKADSISPRGIGEITLSTRVSQNIDWENISYSYAEGASSLSNYTFSVGARATVDGVGRLYGPASVSVIANYRQKKGCYEFRITRQTETDALLSLYKWYPTSRGMEPVLLGQQNYGGMFTSCGIMGTSSTGGTFSSNNWARLSISCTNTADAVHITGVLSRYAVTSIDGAAANPGSETSLVVEFEDDGTKGGAPLRKGSFGVASKDCPAIFMNPRYYDKHIVPGTQGSPRTNTQYPGWTYHNGSYLLTLPNDNAHVCLNTDDDLEDWALEPGRLDIGPRIGDNDNPYYSFLAPEGEQEVEIYLADYNTTTWGNTPAETITVKGFSYATTNINVRVPNKGALQIRTGSESPNSVVIDDVSFTQWRGDDWKNLDGDIIPSWPTSGSTSISSDWGMTNFIFTSGWVKDNSILLSGKRGLTTKPVSIRTPVCDGYEYRNGTSRPIGLGMMAFSWKNAQTNVVLHIQVATNGVTSAINNIDNFGTISDNLGAQYWDTIETLDFSQMDENERAEGLKSIYFGYHGVQGTARILLEPQVIADAAETDDETAFGEIYITKVVLRDEPELDYSCWWGWNLRTVGDEYDTEERMFLPDWSTDAAEFSLSAALNNSVTEDIDNEDSETYKRHIPFIQSPTFGTNIVGEVSFRARKYDADNEFPAQVTVYGSRTGYENGGWTPIGTFVVSNNLYSTYNKTIPVGTENYKAIRIAVTGVNGVDYSGLRDGEGSDAPPPDGVMRVLLDEIMISEAIRAKVGFRNVGAFRNIDKLENFELVENVPSAAEQPLCKEPWGVQCELYKRMLPDRIDFNAMTPKVRLHWFRGRAPWGYENWSSMDGVHTAELAPVDGAELVYRSTYEYPYYASVVELNPEATPGTVVQYMLEVEYMQVSDDGGKTLVTNYLESADWVNPDWYRPKDYNASAKNGAFSAYTILDSVAPGWAWFNEVNIYGNIDDAFFNTDKDMQYVEIAAPVEADLTGWCVRALQPNKGEGTVITNVMAEFGSNTLPATKKVISAECAEVGMVFHVIASLDTYSSGNLKYGEELDGLWSFPNSTDYLDGKYGEVDFYHPFSLQLVRASGVVEQEVTVIGTNTWARRNASSIWNPPNTVEYLNSKMEKANFIYMGEDDRFGPDGLSLTNSLGVFEARGETPNVWTNAMYQTPGKLNLLEDGTKQVIPEGRPTPNNPAMMLFANIDGAHIEQQAAEGTGYTSENLVIYIPKNIGTNIVYKLDPWYEPGEVKYYEIGGTETNLLTDIERVGTTSPSDYSLWRVNGVGEGKENSVGLIASAKPAEVLDQYEIPDEYREAIINWLAQRKSATGNAWPAGDEIYLSKFITLSGAKTNDMTLTEMYWLDICPFVPNLNFYGGYYATGIEVLARKNPYSLKTLNNTIIDFKLFITNANEEGEATDEQYSYTPFDDTYTKRAWAPYVLRGKDPNVTSWDYLDGNWLWTNVSFNVVGKLNNSITMASPRKYWIPLRRFVFDENSFSEDFVSTVEILDPKDEDSPGHNAWADSMGENPSFFFFFELNDGGSTKGVELLEETNLYDWYLEP